jgi:hypothetical protein
LKYLPGNLGILIGRSFTKQLAGRYAEVEQDWRTILADAQNGIADLIAPCMINRGYALHDLKRDDEVLPLMMAAAQMKPDYFGGYRVLVNYYNDADIEPERTLELTEAMMRFARKPRFSLSLGYMDWSQTLA